MRVLYLIPFLISSFVLGLNSATAKEELAKEAEFSIVNLDALHIRSASFNYKNPIEAQSNASQLNKSFTYKRSVAPMLETALNAKINIDVTTIGVERKMTLPTGSEFHLNRQYYRYSSHRGFSLHFREFDMFGKRILRQMVADSYPKHAKVINRHLEFTTVKHTNYICEPDFKKGFNCYYRISLIAKVDGNIPVSEISRVVPKEFFLNLEATDYYHQDGPVLTGTKTKYYKFEFGSEFKRDVVQDDKANNYRFDLLMEELFINNNKAVSLTQLEVMHKAGETPRILDFAFASTNYSKELHSEMKQFLNDLEKNGVKIKREYLSESYSNIDTICQIKEEKPQSFDCNEYDHLEVKVELIK